MLTHQNPDYTPIYVFCCKVMYFFYTAPFLSSNFISGVEWVNYVCIPHCTCRRTQEMSEHCPDISCKIFLLIYFFLSGTHICQFIEAGIYTRHRI